MKWTENGVTFEGTVQEYKELHADGYAPQLTRTRAGKRVTIIDGDNSVAFSSIKAAAEYTGQQTGRSISASALGRALDENGSVKLDEFKGTIPASLFDKNNTTNEGEKNHVE